MNANKPTLTGHKKYSILSTHVRIEATKVTKNHETANDFEEKTDSNCIICTVSRYKTPSFVA